MLKAKNSFWARFSFLKSQKTAAVFLLLLIAGILPVLLFQVKQQQTTQFHAAWYVNRTQHYYCNSALSVDLIIGGINRNLNTGESPDCSTGSNPNASSFQSSMYIKASSGSVGAYTVHWMWAQFWCQNTSTSPCLENGTGQPHTGGLTGDNVAYVIAPSDVKTASSPYSGQACGVYQQDFGFYITDNSDSTQKHLCTSVVLDVNSLGQTNNNASWCNTTKACQGPTNTPAPTNTPTPTHSPTPTHGVTPPTATPTLPINSPTPTATPSATPTATPSAAPTYTPTPSPTLPPGVPTYTPTPTPTKPATTPVNTPTPAPTVIVVRPTLPPTGPSNTVLAVGLVGLALSVLGAIFLLGI